MRAACGAVLGALLVGCGSSSEQAAPAKPKKPATYQQRVSDCIEDVGLKVEPQPEGLKGYAVTSPAGRRVADLRIFPTERESRAFYDQLVVEAVGGEKGVATFSAETKDAEKRVIGDCLTP